MDGRDLQLFGLVLVVYSGLIVVGQGVGNYGGTAYLGMHLGLLVSAVGLFASRETDDGTVDGV